MIFNLNKLPIQHFVKMSDGQPTKGLIRTGNNGRQAVKTPETETAPDRDGDRGKQFRCAVWSAAAASPWNINKNIIQKRHRNIYTYMYIKKRHNGNQRSGRDRGATVGGAEKSLNWTSNWQPHIIKYLWAANVQRQLTVARGRCAGRGCVAHWKHLAPCSKRERAKLWHQRPKWHFWAAAMRNTPRKKKKKKNEIII